MLDNHGLIHYKKPFIKNTFFTFFGNFGKPFRLPRKKNRFFGATIHCERSIALANHKSALKRARQNEIRRMRNKSLRTRTKNVIKEVRAVSAEGSADAAREKLVRAQSVIDKAAKKGAIHKRTAARKIARLSRLVNKISA